MARILPIPRTHGQMIIYGGPDDHLWRKPRENSPLPVTCLVIIYGVNDHLWTPRNASQDYRRPSNDPLPLLPRGLAASPPAEPPEALEA
jgi:hypothetical protein